MPQKSVTVYDTSTETAVKIVSIIWNGEISITATAPYFAYFADESTLSINKRTDPNLSLLIGTCLLDRGIVTKVYVTEENIKIVSVADEETIIARASLDEENHERIEKTREDGRWTRQNHL